MPTPYDAALRVQRREIEELRITIAGQVDAVAQHHATQAGVDAALHEARSVAAAAPLLPTDRYLARMRATHADVVAERRAAEQRLGQVRDQATEAYGRARATEMAADLYRVQRALQRAVAEQRELDDLAAHGRDTSGGFLTGGVL